MKSLSLKITYYLLIFSTFPLVSQGQGTLADYQRAERLNGLIQHKIYDSPTQFKWLSGKKQFFYQLLTKQGTYFSLVEPQKGQISQAFSHQHLATALSKALNKEIDSLRLPVSQLTMDSNGRQVTFVSDGRRWLYSPDSRELKENGPLSLNRNQGFWGDSFDERAPREVISPNGQWIAYTKNNNLHIKSRQHPEKEIALSFDGSPGEYYSSLIYWSPDSKKIAVNKVRPHEPRTLYLIESSPTSQLQPILHTRNYLKPGDALPQKQPCLFLIDEQRQLPLPTHGLENQYSISTLVWRKDSRAFTFEYNQRGHQKYSVMQVNVRGEMTELIKEESNTFFSYSGKKFRYDLEDGKEIIWASERDGWNHLYLYDDKGKVKTQITKGNWVVRNVVYVNDKERWMIFEASGLDQDQDPYFIHYLKINLDGTGLTRLTTENGSHQASFTSDARYFIDTYSRVDAAQVTQLRDARTGKVIRQLHQAQIEDLLATGWRLPEVFSAKGRDGQTDIWGMIIRPSNFDPTKKYPIIEYIYAGPHDSFVPKRFVNDSRGSLHELAELGFIVVQCDGMGTSNRSKAFHDVAWKNLKDGGFPDRIAWIKAAAKKYPYMDIERVGIFGNSAGGQSSLGALLFHPDFYKVAVSSSGCHDNRMDKMWWNEQWMGYPIGPHYAESSNVENAYRLKGKLLLILGELDDNVDPSSTMQVINQLVKANKNFDFLFVPGMKHSLGGDYGEHKRRDFFVKHLIGTDPPEWNWNSEIAIPKP